MASPSTNKQWRLVSYPEGMPTEENWALSEGPVPEPGPDRILARAIYLGQPDIGQRFRLLTSRNLGKQLVQVADEPGGG